MDQALPQTLPLLFTFSQTVVGNGFVAAVRMNGRALLELDRVGDSDESWITGVAPVGVSGGGADRGVAFRVLRKAWTEVVFDIAERAADFPKFEQLCSEFLGANQADITKLWSDAVEMVRKQQYKDPSLRSGDADQQVTFLIEDLSQLMRANHNEVDSGPMVAA